MKDRFAYVLHRVNQASLIDLMVLQGGFLIALGSKARDEALNLITHGDPGAVLTIAAVAVAIKPIIREMYGVGHLFKEEGRKARIAKNRIYLSRRSKKLHQ